MLTWLSWTASYAQTLEISNDTVHCYDRNDMRAIALRVIEATECDTISSMLEAEIILRDSIIRVKDFKIASLKSEIEIRKSMLEEYEDALANCKYNLSMEQIRHKRTKRNWKITYILTVAFMGFLLTR